MDVQFKKYFMKLVSKETELKLGKKFYLMKNYLIIAGLISVVPLKFFLDPAVWKM